MARSSRSPEAFGLILLGGELGDRRAVKALARRARPLICADGGARHAAALGLEPDFVVGDMDSLPKPLPRWPKAVFWCDFDEERGDFDKALDFARDLGLSRVYVAGALGGALDHALVNLAVMAARGAELEIALVDRGTANLLGPGSCAPRFEKGRRFSLLALPPAAVVSLSGAAYPLSRHRLLPGSRGLGNKSLGTVRLRVHSGRLWLMSD
ncbi:MAG: thiamine diphosphokinase [Elusimicrobia bacterium]|nr:thiamine diphosphokinase [Elusimicrobiota bacterium]